MAFLASSCVQRLRQQLRGLLSLFLPSPLILISMKTFKTALALVLAAGLNTAAFAQTTPINPGGTMQTTPGTTNGTGTMQTTPGTTNGTGTMQTTPGTTNGTMRSDDGTMRNGTMRNADGTMQTRKGSMGRRTKNKGNMTNGKGRMKNKAMN